MSQPLHLPTLCTIPYSVLADDRIAESIKIYFGILCGLSHTYGHCFAADEQLAEMKKVSVKTIEKWNSLLENCGHIRRDTRNVWCEKKDQWIRKRDIYVVLDNTKYLDSKKDFETRQNAGFSGGTRRNAGYNYKCSNRNSKKEQQHVKKESCKESKKEAPSAVVVFPSLQKLEVDEAFRIKIIIQHPKMSEPDWNLAVERCLAWPTRRSDEAAILTVLRDWKTWKDKPKQEDTINENLKYLESMKHLDQTKIGETVIDVGYKYFGFISGSLVSQFSIESKDFIKDIEKFKNNLEERVKENEKVAIKRRNML